MTNRTKRLVTAAVLGIPSAVLLLIIAKNLLTYGIVMKLRDLALFAWLWGQVGLAYRAFETREDFDSPPWLAYFVSYQVRLLPAAIFISTVCVLIVAAAKVPDKVAPGIAGPLVFLFGREPNLKDFLKVLEIKR